MGKKKDKVMLYVVARLNTNVDVKLPETDEVKSFKIENCAGCMPVFYTREEAVEHSEQDKYQIFTIQTK